MKKRNIGIIFVLILTLVLTACGGGGDKPKEEGAQTDKDTLTVAVSADATSLDPENYNDIYSENVMKQIYNKLMEKDADENLEPALATGIDQPDDKTYIVHLRDDVVFHNGEPLTTEDVIYSLTRVANSAKYAYIFDKIDLESFETPDEHTLQFKLTEPDGSFLQALSHPAASIVNKKAVEEAGENYAQNPIGTGPFKMESWTKLDNITLKKNDEFWGDAPTFSTLVFRVIPEGNNRVIELESGGVDIAYQIAPTDISKVEENENLQLLRKMDNSIHFVGLKVSDGPFADIKAREALAYAVDMKTIVESVYEGVGSVATGPVNPNFAYSISPDTEPVPYDPEKAKQLFEEAGVAPGTTFKMYVNDNPQRQDMATIIQSQLREIGYDATITTLEWGAYTEALKNKEHDIFFMSWSPSVVDPHYALYGPFHSKNVGEGPNYMYYSNPELDPLLDQAIQLNNGDEREKLYKEAQEMILKDYPWLYVANGENVIGAQSYIKNLELSPSSSQALYKVTFE
ncbi:MAG: ABC transporter substrate-binding protein [Tissierellia bacterium]|nr:ABC transporter substrate-binding protein [Tissierellia bacterium]